MLFNSYAFVFVFLPLVLGVFFTLCYFKLQKAAQLSLLASSLAFYGYWDVRFLPLLGGSIVFNYFLGNRINEAKKTTAKKFYLYFSVIFNLSLLFYFKYLNFFISSTNYLLGWQFDLVNVILPLGISFFTFTQIAYLVDVYQSKASPTGWGSYGLFVTIFPHLISGPVLHHRDMISQFDDASNYRWSSENFANGTFLFVMGMVKKVLIADNLIPFVSNAFDKGQTEIAFLQAWIGALAYMIELYFDFSGYSDMAVGLGLYFNVKLPINFNSPYQATSIIDFWRRWHISLSNFLRDYLYIPLGGSRKGEFSKFRNLVITMFLGGIWHGANWTFIIWGGCQGVFLVVNHLWRKLNIPMSNFLGHFITMFVFIVSLAVFRSHDLTSAYDMLKGLFGFNGLVLPRSYESALGFLKDYGVLFKTNHLSNARMKDLVMMIALLMVTFILPNSMYWKERFLKRPVLWGAISSAAFITCVLNLQGLTEFLYYQF